ncbi:hypothetical protein MBLNU459_g7876t1 [Dothideomycetes sp. NU459]
MVESTFQYLCSEYFPYQSLRGSAPQVSVPTERHDDGEEEDVLSMIEHPSYPVPLQQRQENFDFWTLAGQNANANAAPWDPNGFRTSFQNNEATLPEGALNPPVSIIYPTSEAHSLEERSAADSGYCSIRKDLGNCSICQEKKGVLKYFKNNADKKSEYKPSIEEIEALAQRKNEAKPKKSKKAKSAVDTSTVCSDMPEPVPAADGQWVGNADSKSGVTPTEPRLEDENWNAEIALHTWGADAGPSFELSNEIYDDRYTLAWPQNPNNLLMDLQSGDSSFDSRWSGQFIQEDAGSDCYLQSFHTDD